MRRFVIALLSLLALTGVAHAHDGWSRSEITDRAEELLGKDIELSVMEGLPGNLFLLDPTEEASCFLGANDQVRSFAAGDFAHIVLIGSKERIHTVWAYFPIVGVSDTDAAFAFFKGFFGGLLPAWPQASTWAEKSLADAWGPSAAAFQDPMISFNETIARASTDGILLATMGIPPDLVTYRLTTRGECEKVSEYMLAKPRRASCDPNHLYPEDALRQVLLYRTHPQPVDRSETPFFLGEVSAQARISDSLDFDLPGGLVDAAGLDWGEWIPRQMQGTLELEQIVSEDWLCASHFTYLISAPDLAPASSTWLLSVESISALATRAGDEISYDMKDASGLLFSKAAPAIPPRPPSPEPPYLSVQPDQLVFLSEGDSTPVDISATPILLGPLSFNVGQAQSSGSLPFNARVEGLSLVVSSQSSAATATLDLAEWLARQRGAAPAPDRARPISDPSIDFELDGRAYRLVLRSAWFEAEGGSPLQSDGIRGVLFAGKSE